MHYRALSALIARKQHLIADIGAFQGWGGLIYTFTHLGALWNDSSLLRAAETFVDRLPPLIEADDQLDIIAGSAGCIGALLALYRTTGFEQAVETAILCGDRLVAQAQTLENGIGWHTAMSGATAWTGFSHGTAGIAWALLELCAVANNPHYKSIALAAIEYERSTFSNGTWLDLRTAIATEDELRSVEVTGRSFSMAWCNGAPGIGLARLRSLSLLDDNARTEIELALRTTLQRGFGDNHCLCHGDLGNLELLLEASRELYPEIRTEVDQAIVQILNDIQRNGWRCGVPSGVELPGLMAGLAGIGYGLLRLSNGFAVPSILMLDPPKREFS